MKKHNPSIPIMLREAQGTLPKVYARYDFGKEKSQSLEGMGIFILAHLSGCEVELERLEGYGGGRGVKLGTRTMG